MLLFNRASASQERYKQEKEADVQKNVPIARQDIESLQSVIIFVIDDSNIVRTLKTKQVVRMVSSWLAEENPTFPLLKEKCSASPNVQIVSVADARSVNKWLRAYHKRGEAPLFVFMDKNFYLDGELNTEAETLVLKEITKLFGKNVGIASISSEYAVEERAGAPGQAGEGYTLPAGIDFPIAKSACLMAYNEDIQNRVTEIFRDGGPSCQLPLNDESDAVTEGDEKHSTGISMDTREEEPRARALSLPGSRIGGITSAGFHSAPVTTKGMNVKLEKCTVVLIGRKLDKAINSIVIAFQRVQDVHFVFATDLAGVENCFEMLRTEGDPPSLVVTVGDQEHQAVATCVNKLLNNVTLHHVENDTLTGEELNKIHQNMIIKDFQQRSIAACQLEEETAAVTSPRKGFGCCSVM
jgi:hypothetical protein